MMKKVLRFIISHSIFISICAVALTFQTQELLHLKLSVSIYSFIFFATLCSYNFYWLLSKISFAKKSVSINYFKQEKLKFILLFLSSFFLFYSFKSANIRLVFIIPCVILTMLYALPLLHFSKIIWLRKLGIFKTFILAFTWTYVTVYLPIQKPILNLIAADYFILTRRFLFMLMLCIIFDSRDVSVDKIRGLHSIATDIAPKILHWIIGFIFSALFITNFYFQNYGITFCQSIALQISTTVLLVAYFFSTKKQGYFFYYFFIDGLMLFSALGTWLATVLG